ncbi:hypothetical protein L6164_026052 [Bauhinia variegata]|uniref:Uncharacterized protein n=1 Tax=Bauhinia variegata TaxID=167791 RepID=A0ACB9M2Q4_BAUVA|nr:hypothetical protein L6164_026052 [Bauhinia variegata]
MMARSSSQIVLLLLWFLCGAIFGLSLSTSNSQKRCNKKDRDILLQFKKGVVDPARLLTSWSNSEDCCKWIGVQCHNITGRVSKLNLNYYFISQHNYSLQGLTGEINLCVLQLDSLSYLDLSENNFTVIHDSRNDRQRYYNSSLLTPNANISSLHYLDLSWNFDLKIDNWRWLSHIPSLKYLNMSYIDLHRETDWLQSISTLLPSLLKLRLQGCQLNTVRPSSKYVNFTSLKVLDISNNMFNSKTIGWVSDVSHSLSYLNLCSNHIDCITDTLLNLQNLQHLSLSQNKLNGTIPKWLGQYKNLQKLYLSSNSFHGSIPLDLGNISSLIHLDISNNHLNGSLPESLHKLSSLESLIVAGNSLGGVLSESNFVNLTNLKVLDLTSSTFLFNISSDWIPPFQLTELQLESSILGPEFPTWIYSQGFLEVLDIPNTGIISVDHDKFWSFVSQMTFSIDISNNLISGNISNLVLNTVHISDIK